MNIKNEELKQLLLKENYITAEDITKADDFLKTERGTLIDFLINEGMITKPLLGQALAESLKTDFADLVSNPPIPEKILQIPEQVAEKYNVVFFSENEKNKEVSVATEDPQNKDLPKELKKIFGSKKVTIKFAFLDDIRNLFIFYRKPLQQRVDEIVSMKDHRAPEIFAAILEDALAFHASDIHIEPFEKRVTVRLRIDGILHDVVYFAKEHYENVLNWVKVQSKMRIDEHRKPQDGSMRIIKDEHAIDMRVSTAPIIDGENIVIRILSAYVRSFVLEDLGLSSTDRETITKTAKMPYGMFLMTGPTGSGKTTTLYALIKILNKPDMNITTIEDPIEYKIAGINQIQVNTQTNLTFSNGLRSIVRQDPNVILVGEIRDHETAEIAVNAALTGHLLFSTFHANDAATSIPRLLDMGIEPFILSSTIKVVAAQRLVRQICKNCRYSKMVKKAELQGKLAEIDDYFKENEVLLYQGKGCAICNNTGFKDRLAIFEFIRISPEMQNLIAQNPSGKQIWELAASEGAISLFEDGIEKVKQGITTLDELLRVCNPPQIISANIKKSPTKNQPTKKSQKSSVKSAKTRIKKTTKTKK